MHYITKDTLHIKLNNKDALRTVLVIYCFILEISYTQIPPPPPGGILGWNAAATAAVSTATGMLPPHCPPLGGS